MQNPGSSLQVARQGYSRTSEDDGGAGSIQNQGLTEPLLGKYRIPSYVQDTDTQPADIYAPAIQPEHLRRGLSARQVQMIALAGTIGTGLFLGTGKSLAEGKCSP